MLTSNQTLLALLLLTACGPKPPEEPTAATLDSTSSGEETSESSGSVVGTTTGAPGSSTGPSTGASTGQTTDTGDTSTGMEATTGGPTSSTGDGSSSTGEGTTEQAPTTGGDDSCDYVIPCNLDSECTPGTSCQKLPTEGSVCVAPCVGSEAATNCQAAIDMCALPALLKCQHSASAGLFCFPVL